ncbi:MAG: glycosyltransferase family 87 protein [Pseudomonadota bacterium]
MTDIGQYTRSDWFVYFAAVALFLAAVFGISGSFLSHDFHAYYMGAYFASIGDWTNVYPTIDEMRGLSFPAAWSEKQDIMGANRNPQSPYIYPPLWAWLFGLLQQLISFEAMRLSMVVLVSLGIVATIEGIRRLIAEQIPPIVALVLGISVLFLTTVGIVALNELQIQTIVSALILWAFAFAQSDRKISAGLCLAFAASIKLYPILFAAFWIARKDWRALIACFGFGVLLGLTSVLVGGIETTFHFLNVMRTANDLSIMITSSLGLTPILSSLHHSIIFETIASPEGFSFENQRNISPLYISAGVKAASLGLVVLLAIISARSDQKTFNQAILPGALIGVTLCLPLAWAHSYIVALFFIPLAAYTMRSWSEIIVLCLLLGGCGSWLLLIDPFGYPVRHVAIPIISTMSMLGIFAIYFIRALRRT